MAVTFGNVSFLFNPKGRPTNLTYAEPDGKCPTEDDFPIKPEHWTNNLCAVIYMVSAVTIHNKNKSLILFKFTL
jgi:hypothetical protein